MLFQSQLQQIDAHGLIKLERSPGTYFRAYTALLLNRISAWYLNVVYGTRKQIDVRVDICQWLKRVENTQFYNTRFQAPVTCEQFY